MKTKHDKPTPEKHQHLLLVPKNVIMRGYCLKCARHGMRSTARCSVEDFGRWKKLRKFLRYAASY